jgi:carboxymethylenebutenolidase
MKRDDPKGPCPDEPSARVTRRVFLGGLVGAGFALAAQPIAAGTAIHTDDRGLTADAVSIPVADGTITAYRAKPADAGNPPVVLVVHEIFGLHEHIRDVCRRLARLGYMAIAPALFTRQGDVSKLASIEAIRPIVAKVPDAQVMSDLDACMAWAATDGGDTGRLGVTGFCWGGRIVWLYSAHQAAVKAGVAWYGKLDPPGDALHPRQPVDIAAQLKAPVLGLYGGKDPNIPLQSVEAMRTAIRAVHGHSEIVVYPDASHAFFADYRPSYHKAAAEDGWRRMQDWFRQYGA